MPFSNDQLTVNIFSNAYVNRNVKCAAKKAMTKAMIQSAFQIPSQPIIGILGIRK